MKRETNNRIQSHVGLQKWVSHKLSKLSKTNRAPCVQNSENPEFYALVGGMNREIRRALRPSVDSENFAEENFSRLRETERNVHWLQHTALHCAARGTGTSSTTTHHAGCPPLAFRVAPLGAHGSRRTTLEMNESATDCVCRGSPVQPSFYSQVSGLFPAF